MARMTASLSSRNPRNPPGRFEWTKKSPDCSGLIDCGLFGYSVADARAPSLSTKYNNGVTMTNSTPSRAR